MRAVALAALAATLAAACAVGPDYRAAAPSAPPAFTTPGSFDGAAPPARWWRVLDDDNLAALVERATGGANLDVQIAAARIRTARAELGVAAAETEPSVNVNAQVSRDRFSRESELFANFASFPLLKPQVLFTDLRAGFDASWEIDVFGHARREVESARARVQAAEASLADARVAVAGEVARTYVGLRQGERLLALAEADLAALQDSARLVELRFDAGNANALEAARARAAADAQGAQLDALRAQNGAARDALAVLVGVAPGEIGALLDPARPVPRISAERLAVGLPSTLLQRRADVRRAERELAAATADIGVATADLYPRFELVGNFGVDTVEAGALWQKAAQTWSVGPQLYLPLLGRGRLTSEVRAREAARDEAQAAYRKAVLGALSDVEAAMIRFDRARAQEAELRRSWQELEATAALVRAQFDAGRSSRIDVLDADRAARQAQEQHTDALAGLDVQLVALYKALGGGWDVDGR